MKMYRIDDSSLRVVAGEHSLSVDSGLEQDSFPVSYTVHEEYNPDNFKNDIALIFVSEFITYFPFFSTSVNCVNSASAVTIFVIQMNQAPLDLSVPSAKPINLPAPTFQYDPPAGTHVNVSGWGFTNVSLSILELQIQPFKYLLFIFEIE